MPKNERAYKFQIEYCDSWVGRPEASYCYKLLKTVYPKGKFNMYSPGYTGNLIVLVNNMQIYNKKRGDGIIQTSSAVNFLNRVASLIESSKLWVKRKSQEQRINMITLG